MSQEPSTTRPTFVRTAIVLGAAVLAALGGGYALAANTPSQVVSPPAASQSPSVLVGITPVRVLDTRGAAGGPIGVPAAKKLGPGESIDVAVGGVGAIPANATSVAVNITIDEDATLKSFLTVWPAGQTRPNTSANNAEPGLVSANSAIFQLGIDGKLSVFNQTGTVNVIMDVTGYFLACAPPSGGTTTTTTAGTTTTTEGTTTTTAPGATTAPDCTAPSGTTPTVPAPTLTAGTLTLETGLAFTGTGWTGCSAITVTAIGTDGGSATGITPLPDGSISGNVSLGLTPTGNYLLVAQGTPSETCRAETTFTPPAA